MLAGDSRGGDAAIHSAVSAAMAIEADGDRGRDALRLMLLCEARAAVMGESLHVAELGRAEARKELAEESEAAAIGLLGGAHTPDHRMLHMSHTRDDELLSLSAFESFIWAVLCSCAKAVQHSNVTLASSSGPGATTGASSAMLPTGTAIPSHALAHHARPSAKVVLRSQKRHQQRLCRRHGRCLAPAVIEWVLAHAPVAIGPQLVAGLGRIVEAVRLHADNSAGVEQFTRLCGLQVRGLQVYPPRCRRRWRHTCTACTYQWQCELTSTNCACACARVRARVRACVCACVRARVCGPVVSSRTTSFLRAQSTRKAHPRQQQRATLTRGQTACTSVAVVVVVGTAMTTIRLWARGRGRRMAGG